MYLAESISHSLNGRRSGKGFRIPAFWRGSTDLNVYIADSDNGKLIVADHSHGDDYQTIMQALEAEGLKPKDDFNPAQKKQFIQKKSRRQLRNALQIETHITLQYLNDRDGDIEKLSDRNYLKLHPEFAPMPDDLWDRERLAYTRIIKIIGELL